VMANVLKMTVIQTIHSLRSAGLSFREISVSAHQSHGLAR
jgi:hypothetical protein